MKLVKVISYDKVLDAWLDSYINPEQIQQITSIPERDGSFVNLVKFEDMAIRVSYQSYKKLIKLFYGEEYGSNNQSKN